MEIEQGSIEWFAARCGKVTASRVADVMARTKTGWSATRANYHAQLVAERLTGAVSPSFASPEMRWGTEQEPEARRAYEFVTDLSVTQIGFVDHPTVDMSGASPDGLVRLDGLIEIKCPNTATHIETLLSEKVPARYVSQMQWQMACTERAWCDFVSFDPRMPAEMQLWVRRVERDEAAIRQIEDEVRLFLGEVETTVRQLMARVDPEGDFRGPSPPSLSGRDRQPEGVA